MIVSLNEAQVMATKAASGAGRPWGLAQEAGLAVATLEAMRLPGAASLLGLLLETDGEPCEKLRPISTSGSILQGKGPMCPILIGTYYADSDGVDRRTHCELHCIRYPLLLLHFARLPWDSVKLEWQDTTVVSNFNEASVRGTGLTATIGDTVLISSSEPLNLPECGSPHLYQPGPVDIADEIWESLSAFAHRTYVPASESSRLKGAGAGLTDND